MKNIVNTYVERFRADHQKARRMTSLLLALALLVACGVFWQLHYTGIALTNETYCGLEEHTHTEDCYETALTCTLEEREGHTHTEDCCETETTLICALEESEGHTHTEDCYDEEGNLTCELEECEGHTHTEDCYETEEMLVCALEESEGHTHTEDCYETVLTCTLEEHTHTVACMSDETADVETADDWEATLPELTGVWAEDVAAVAESQLGYTESTANFTLDEDGETRRGYTRYGAWAGNEYGGWDAMFASFCLYYGGVSTEDFPESTGAYAWAVKLDECGLYAEAADCAPVPGDLVFFDTDGDGKADRVGIVTGVDATSGDLTVIEGDCETDDGADAVAENTYAADDGTILGYGVLPEQETEEEAEEGSDEEGADGEGTDEEGSDKECSDEEGSDEEGSDEEGSDEEGADGEGADGEGADGEGTDEEGSDEEGADEEGSDEEGADEVETETYTASADGVTVTVTAPVGALPEGAELTVALLDEDSDAYATAAEAIGYDGEDEDTGMAALDIAFHDGDGLKVEPSGAVTVSIDASALLPEDADAGTIEVQHLAETEDGVETVLVADASEDTAGTVDAETVTAEFEVESFSTFTITWSGQQGPRTTTYFAITVHYVDESGADIDDVTTSNITASNGETYTFSDYAVSIDGYLYSKATYDSATGSEVTTATFTATTTGQGPNQTTTRTLTLDDENGTVLTYNNTTVYVDVYLVYEQAGLTLTITDTIVDDGNINAVFSGTVPDGATVTYTWYCDGTEVENKKIGSTYILSDDGSSLNVALAGCNGNTYTVVATVTTADEETTEYTAEYTVPYYSSLQNGSFETPSNPNTSSDAVWGNQWSNASYLANGGVWQTTGTYSGSSGNYQDIEVINATVNADNSSGYSWYNGYNQTFSNGVSATEGTTDFSVPDGVQFVELNCEASGALYQDVLTVPGSTLNWWLNHRARGNNQNSTAESDTMYLLIMSTELADYYGIDTQEDVMKVINNINDYPGAAYWTFTSDDQQWYYYSSDGTSTDATGKTLSPYTVPDDQYLTRFFFVAGDTASGNTTVGNFLDDVGFTTAPLPSVDGEGNLQVKKVVYGLPEDVIKGYSVTFTVYAEDGTTVVGTVTLDYDDYVASESGTLNDGTLYYTLVDYISVTSADKTTGTNYLVKENAVTVSGYIWNEGKSTAVDYYYTAGNAVTVLENSTTTITYSNYYEAGVELPSTGGPGLWMYTLAGLTLCGGAGVLFFRRKRQG